MKINTIQEIEKRQDLAQIILREQHSRRWLMAEPSTAYLSDSILAVSYSKQILFLISKQIWNPAAPIYKLFPISLSNSWRSKKAVVKISLTQSNAWDFKKVAVEFEFCLKTKGGSGRKVERIDFLRRKKGEIGLIRCGMIGSAGKLGGVLLHNKKSLKMTGGSHELETNGDTEGDKRKRKLSTVCSGGDNQVEQMGINSSIKNTEQVNYNNLPKIRWNQLQQQEQYSVSYREGKENRNGGQCSKEETGTAQVRAKIDEMLMVQRSAMLKVVGTGLNQSPTTP